MAWLGEKGLIAAEPGCGLLCCLSAFLPHPEHQVRVVPACGLVVGGCSLPVPGRVYPTPVTSGPSLFFLPFKQLLNEVNDFALGNASVKPQALRGHRPCLHVSLHVPVALPSIPNPSSCESLAGREQSGEALSTVQHRAVGD